MSSCAVIYHVVDPFGVNVDKNFSSQLSYYPVCCDKFYFGLSQFFNYEICCDKSPKIYFKWESEKFDIEEI